jgi:hypothetical protein
MALTKVDDMLRRTDDMLRRSRRNYRFVWHLPDTSEIKQLD